MPNGLRDVSANLEFPVRVYVLILNGAGTTSEDLSLFVEQPEGLKNDVEMLKEDVLNGVVTHLMIEGHPYEVSYYADSKYFVTFKIKNSCNVFPFPECASREPIESITTSIVHALGYKPL